MNNLGKLEINALVFQPEQNTDHVYLWQFSEDYLLQKVWKLHSQR